MAFIKEKETDFGLTANYWKLAMITIDRNMKEASFSFNLYFKKDAKQFIDTYIVSDFMGNPDKTLYEEYFESDKYPHIFIACHDYAKKYVEFFKDAEMVDTDI